jgi:Protein of unknown function (DUF2877)
VNVWASAAPLSPVPGFESTAYALQHGRVVWAGLDAVTDHPRNAHRPWQPARQRLSPQRLRAGAARLAAALKDGTAGLEPRGLLFWLCGQPLPFPMQPAQARFEALRVALHAQDLPAFEAAALRVLGLGPGLTPSGDDFLGALLFTLRHAPVPAWKAQLPAVRQRLLQAARTATNPISAALLADLMAGCSYRALHELLTALHQGAPAPVFSAAHALLAVGASSGADMLAGVLVALQSPFVSDCT